jgi:hypothetical protein
MGEGDVFGDLSFLDATSLLASPSASIIADGEVAITKLEGEKILQIFVANPPFAGRFYRFVSFFFFFFFYFLYFIGFVDVHLSLAMCCFSHA